nr:MAG TPA_asm: hypothetical protein [Caudoviricetes sp.]
MDINGVVSSVSNAPSNTISVHRNLSELAVYEG